MTQEICQFCKVEIILSADHIDARFNGFCMRRNRHCSAYTQAVRSLPGISTGTAGLVKKVRTGCRMKDAAASVLKTLTERAELVKANVLTAAQNAAADHAALPLDTEPHTQEQRRQAPPGPNPRPSGRTPRELLANQRFRLYRLTELLFRQPPRTMRTYERERLYHRRW